MRSFFLALAAIAGTVAVSGGTQAAPVALQPPTLIAAAPGAEAGPGQAAVETVQYYRGRRYYRRNYYRRYYRRY